MRKILNYHMDAVRKKLFNDGLPKQWYLLQCNSPIHTSDEIKNCLHILGITCLDFPPYSPHLTPTEHLFADLARRADKHYPKTADELKQAIRTEWPLTDIQFLNNLATSMPNRIADVLRNAGHATKY